MNSNNSLPDGTEANASRLVSIDGLLSALWAPDGRPSKRWIQSQQKARTIPFIRVGRRVFFSIERVRAALEAKHTIGGKR